MANKKEQERITAIDRYLSGENPNDIIKSIGKGKVWLYKWIRRYKSDDPFWYQEKSKRPNIITEKIPYEIKEAIKIIRLSLYNKNLFYGAQAIQWELEEIGVKPIPSLRTINRILSKNDLTHRRTGKYVPKGTPYPKLLAENPNQLHQADFIGPLYLNGPIRFYSLNIIDIATGRCGIQPINSRKSQNTIDSLWSIWRRLGIPKHLQIDNGLVFYGSNRHPHGMSAFIRLCLHYDVELWFIPVKEPWRNGVVEKFNEHYRQKFLNKVHISSNEELLSEALKFESKHNNEYRYSKLKGKTPMKSLQERKCKLKFPPSKHAPQLPLDKPAKGRYHFVRLIKSDLRLNIFSEKFYLPSDLMYEYVIATVDVKDQKLKVFHNNITVEEFNYKL